MMTRGSDERVRLGSSSETMRKWERKLTCIVCSWPSVVHSASSPGLYTAALQISRSMGRFSFS